MSDNAEVNRGRRTLVIASACAGGAAAVATAVPFAASMLPSDRAKALGAPVEADIGQLAPGEKMTVEWRGQPVWILRRTPEMLADVKKDNDKVADPESKRKQDELTPVYARNEYRSIKPEYLHPSRMHADRQAAARQRAVRAGLERRVLLPVPRVAVRPRRPRVQEQARARQSARAALHLPGGQQDPDRRRQEGSLGPWPQPTSSR